MKTVCRGNTKSRIADRALIEGHAIFALLQRQLLPRYLLYSTNGLVWLTVGSVGLGHTLARLSACIVIT